MEEYRIDEVDDAVYSEIRQVSFEEKILKFDFEIVMVWRPGIEKVVFNDIGCLVIAQYRMVV